MRFGVLQPRMSQYLFLIVISFLTLLCVSSTTIIELCSNIGLARPRTKLCSLARLRTKLCSLARLRTKLCSLARLRTKLCGLARLRTKLCSLARLRTKLCSIARLRTKLCSLARLRTRSKLCLQKLVCFNWTNQERNRRNPH